MTDAARPLPAAAAPPLRLHLDGPEATAALAARLAPATGPGDVLLLAGPIGAGKTHFARALIQTLLATAGRAEDVPSPTFTLVQVYDGPAAEIWHSDLYRLTDPAEVEELGLTEAFDTALCLVEWPDRLGPLTPADALTLTFSASADGPVGTETRDLTLRAGGPRSAALLAHLTGGSPR